MEDVFSSVFDDRERRESMVDKSFLGWLTELDINVLN